MTALYEHYVPLEKDQKIKYEEKHALMTEWLLGIIIYNDS